MNINQEVDEAAEADKRLGDYLKLPGVPDTRLNPRWLAQRLDLELRPLLSALADAVREGLVEMHWEVFCPGCNLPVEEFNSMKQAHRAVVCVPCEKHFELHLDRDVRVTFSATERARRARGATSEPMRLEDDSLPPTRGLDLLFIPAFRELFSGALPAPEESLHIGRVAILFTDLRGSTAMYAERGDPAAYHIVRQHFSILGEVIESNGGAVVKTIGDAVMASFCTGAEAMRAAFEAQTRLHEHAAEFGGELIMKAGVHAGACLSVTLNERLDFFGGAVNIAARVQGLSEGNDVVITDEVFTDLHADAEAGADEDRTDFAIAESFEANLRGLPQPVRVYRLSRTTGEVGGSGKESV